jgi:hypothetical protein
MKLIKWVLVILIMGLLCTIDSSSNDNCLTDMEISEELKSQFPDATHQEIEDMMFK